MDIQYWSLNSLIILCTLPARFVLRWVMWVDHFSKLLGWDNMAAPGLRQGGYLVVLRDVSLKNQPRLSPADLGWKDQQVYRDPSN